MSHLVCGVFVVIADCVCRVVIVCRLLYYHCVNSIIIVHCMNSVIIVHCMNSIIIFH